MGPLCPVKLLNVGLEAVTPPAVVLVVAAVDRDIPSSRSPLGWPRVLEEPRLGFNGLSVRDGGRARGTSAVPPVTLRRMPGRGGLPFTPPEPEAVEPVESVVENTAGSGRTISSSASPAA